MEIELKKHYLAQVFKKAEECHAFNFVGEDVLKGHRIEVYMAEDVEKAIKSHREDAYKMGLLDGGLKGIYQKGAGK